MNDQKATDQEDHEPEPELEFEVEVVSGETLDALPIRARRSMLQTRQPGMAPVQAAAVAATGFLAGAATLALLNRRRLSHELSDLRELRDRYEAARRGPTPFGMAPGKTYLVQIRVLGRPPE